MTERPDQPRQAATNADPDGTNHPVWDCATAAEPLSQKGSRRSRRVPVTDFAPKESRLVAPRLLSLQQAAAYTSLSYWTIRDLILTGVVPSVRVPLTRVNDGPRRGEHRELPPHRVPVDPADPRVAGRATRRVLVDRIDLDRLIDSWKERR